MGNRKIKTYSYRGPGGSRVTVRYRMVGGSKTSPYPRRLRGVRILRDAAGRFDTAHDPRTKKARAARRGKKRAPSLAGVIPIGALAPLREPQLRLPGLKRRKG